MKPHALILLEDCTEMLCFINNLNFIELIGLQKMQLHLLTYYEVNQFMQTISKLYQPSILQLLLLKMKLINQFINLLHIMTIIDLQNKVSLIFKLKQIINAYLHSYVTNAHQDLPIVNKIYYD